MANRTSRTFPRPTRPTAPAGLRPGAPGFTLIEIMVAISIIVILVGMLIGGFRYVDNQSRGKATRVTLNNLRAMYAEVEQAMGPRWEASIYGTNVLGAPGDVYTAGKPDRHGGAVSSTQTLMGTILTNPSCKAMVTKLPHDQFLRTLNGSSESQVVLDPPVILDGWNNPIIFVPSAGMSGVTVGGTAVPTKVAPDGKGYFASAGPDGNFAQGDDNMYSFEN